MNVDEMLRALNDEQVEYLLIGGMNFLIRHQPELTFDVDIWVDDEPENLRCSDEDMLSSQEALSPNEQKPRRMEFLRQAIRQAKQSRGT